MQKHKEITWKTSILQLAHIFPLFIFRFLKKLQTVACMLLLFSRFCHLMKYGFTSPLQWYLHPVMVEGHVSSSRPESLANSCIATSRVSQARQIKKVVTRWREMLIEKGTLINSKGCPRWFMIMQQQEWPEWSEQLLYCNVEKNGKTTTLLLSWIVYFQ